MHRGVVQFTFYWRAEPTQHYWHTCNQPSLTGTVVYLLLRERYYAPYLILAWRTNPLACNQPSLTGTGLTASRALLCPIPSIPIYRAAPFYPMWSSQRPRAGECIIISTLKSRSRALRGKEMTTTQGFGIDEFIRHWRPETSDRDSHCCSQLRICRPCEGHTSE